MGRVEEAEYVLDPGGTVGVIDGGLGILERIG
jgi:hypothetical protein